MCNRAFQLTHLSALYKTWFFFFFFIGLPHTPSLSPSDSTLTPLLLQIRHKKTKKKRQKRKRKHQNTAQAQRKYTCARRTYPGSPLPLKSPTRSFSPLRRPPLLPQPASTGPPCFASGIPLVARLVCQTTKRWRGPSLSLPPPHSPFLSHPPTPADSSLATPASTQEGSAPPHEENKKNNNTPTTTTMHEERDATDNTHTEKTSTQITHLLSYFLPFTPLFLLFPSSKKHTHTHTHTHNLVAWKCIRSKQRLSLPPTHPLSPPPVDRGESGRLETEETRIKWCGLLCGHE